MLDKYSESLPFVTLDTFCIMPDHIHGIIIINQKENETISPLKHGTSKTVGSIVRGFKVGVTKWVRKNGLYEKIWLRNYYERIIRDQYELDNVRYYIKNNPLRSSRKAT